MASKLLQHVPDMLRYRHAARTADVVHFQWLPVQHLDGRLLPANRTDDGKSRPLVLTAHDVLPREPRRGQLVAQRRLYDRFDAIVVHSEHGRRRLIDELGVDGGRVHVIPHGVFTHLAESQAEGSRGMGGGVEGSKKEASTRARMRTRASTTLSPESNNPVSDNPVSHDRASDDSVRDHSGSDDPASNPVSNHPVALMFGLMRPYKGINVLLDAWRGADGEAPIDGAELWVVGMPKMDISAFEAVVPPNVRFDPRFIADDELSAYFERADLVVLPYLQADQSGVLFTALAFGKPLLLSDVGGFPEMASTGAARIVPAGDPRALGTALRELLADRATLAEMCVRARAAATGRYSWQAIAAAHIELYRSL